MIAKELIKAIIFTEFDEELGPNPILWYPSDLPESFRMAVSIKSITILSADQGLMPKSLIIMPFPSLTSKGIIKYIEKEDHSRRGGVAQSSITLLFSEIDDLIFYKYLSFLEPAFNKITQEIINIEDIKKKKDILSSQIDNLRTEILNILEDLRVKEQSALKSEAFPEEPIEDKGIIKYKFKVVVCGDPGVGKTSTILRFTDNAFRRTYIATIGVSISEKNVLIDKDTVNFILWDIAGQLKFEMMRKHYYKGAEAAFLIFDLTNPESLKNIPKWYQDITKEVKLNHNLPMMIIGNKCDLTEKRMIKRKEAEDIAKKLSLDYYETSALTGENIHDVFKQIAKKCIETELG
ncbi:MAG: Rab family GTPase [Promethearchaeota archaeon]